ncbi:MAG TPA: ABC transporter permease [Edaphobacter sp.]|nr:ABC transporter permease [Edaphobacter sp.]
MMGELWTRLRFFVSRRSRGELDEELQFHVEQSTAANIAAGMTPEAARRQALVEFGGVERTREECNEQRPGWLMETVVQDVRYALRGFRRNPLFSVTVIATLALGIGATTAVFSVVDRILFRDLPYGHADRLVSVGLVQSLEKQEFTLGSFYYYWKDNQTPFESITQEGGVEECDLTEQNPTRLNCASVEGDFLLTMGIAPIRGRNFLPEEDRPNGPMVALISYGLWLTHYNLDAKILDKVIQIDGKPVRVVGVLPKDFEMPRLQAADIVVPRKIDVGVQHKVNSGIGYPMWAFARLKPGVSAEQAQAALGPVYEYAQKIIPPEIRKDFHLKVRSLRDRQIQDVRLVAWVLLGAALAVLMIACANVASLFLTRAAARERELAVRSALGASRGRLIRQTLTEALLLAFAGAAAGCVVAEILLRVFVAIAPAGVPFLDKARLDPRILVFAALLSLACGVMSGLVPALHRPRAIVLAARSTNSRAHAGLRRSLVVAQIAISMVLLSSATLLLRSFRNLQGQNLGMQASGVLTVRMSLTRDRYASNEKKMEFYDKAEAALRRVPGVTAVGMSDSLPPGGWRGGMRYAEIRVEGRPRTPPGTGGAVTSRWVTPDYFRALRIAIVQGRNFTEGERDSSEHWMVMSKLLASRLFPGEDPVGQRVQPGLDAPWYTVVGVAANVKNAELNGEDTPEFYTLRRNFGADWGSHSVMVLETGLPPETVAPWVRTQIATIDPTVPVDVETMQERLSTLADRPRFETALLGFFAFTGLMMAVIGLYGVTAFMVTRRTQEVGVRMALGASRMNILRLIVGEGMRLIVVGGAVGLGAALGVSQVLKSLLFSVGPHDPATFVGVAAVLGLVALAATLIPARSAMQVEPVVALRCD